MPNDSPERQGDVLIAKAYNPATGERGVLIVKYSDAIMQVAAMFDLGALASRYMIVLEPSSWGYQDVMFLSYLGADLDVVVLSPYKPDFDFIQSLRTNLVPIRIGAGDWVDPETFRPAERRTFDVVMVAGWTPIKRHDVLFRAIAILRDHHRRHVRAALVGYPQGWTRQTIERLMRQHGVTGSCTVFEAVPHRDVARIVSESGVSVILSKREGASKALYEGLFCGTPVIVYRHQRGVNLEHITPEVGMLADDAELPEALLHVLDHRESFTPREWALANTGWPRSTARLNDVLQQMAAARGLPWTHGVEPKTNSPNLQYAHPLAYRKYEAEYGRLAEFLIEPD